ncbi:hypothetical protein D3C86_1146900 [compost metagenome]
MVEVKCHISVEFQLIQFFVAVINRDKVLAFVNQEVFQFQFIGVQIKVNSGVPVQFILEPQVVIRNSAIEMEIRFIDLARKIDHFEIIFLNQDICMEIVQYMRIMLQFGIQFINVEFTQRKVGRFGNRFGTRNEFQPGFEIADFLVYRRFGSCIRLGQFAYVQTFGLNI